MRQILGAAFIFLTASAAALMPPLKINYQGRLVDPATSLPKPGPVTLTFSLYRTPDPGDTAWYWQEQQSGVQLANGVFSVQLGTKTLLSADMLANTSAYLGIQVAGDASEMQPRQQLAMSAYAYTAAQLAGETTVRVNAATSYSTFTAGGSLDLQYGLDATTAAFLGQGATLYSVVTSSGIKMSSGTLSLGASSGLDAGGTGILASTATFTASGDTQFSLLTSSGLNMGLGSLKLAAASRGVDAQGTGLIASTLTLAGLASDPSGGNGLMAYNTTANRFRCYENGAWVNCTLRAVPISLGGLATLTNVSNNYDGIALSSGLGVAFVDFTGVTSIEFRVLVKKIGSGTQSWQLWNWTDSAEIGFIDDAGAEGVKMLSATISAGIPTGQKLVKIRAKSTTAADDPVHYGSSILLVY